jgi:hypothetical protein
MKSVSRADLQSILQFPIQLQKLNRAYSVKLLTKGKHVCLYCKISQVPGSEYHGLLCVAHLETKQFDSPAVHLNVIQRVPSQNHSHGSSHPHGSSHDFHHSLQETPVLRTGTFLLYYFHKPSHHLFLVMTFQRQLYGNFFSHFSTVSLIFDMNKCNMVSDTGTTEIYILIDFVHVSAQNW